MTANAWSLGLLSAFVIGFSKTGVPGTGILAVPLMAQAFGGRLSVGATLPLLILADIFAVGLYRAHADWATLRRLTPWVLVGLVIGTVTLRELGRFPDAKDALNPWIGGIVLAMLAVTLLRERLGDRLVPHSPNGTKAVGTIAGFTTMVANAAGPVMQIFLVGSGMGKDALMGTTAWYFLTVNAVKIVPLAYLAWDNPSAPVWSWETARFDLFAAPVLIVGAWVGKSTYSRIPAKPFARMVLFFSAIGAVRLLFM